MRTILIILLASISQFSLAADTTPDFTLKSNQGNNQRLSEYQGQVVLINFWASWCGPCRQEMPLLEEIQQKYAKLGVTVLGINVDKDPSKADKILRETQVSFPILYDSEGEVSKLFKVKAMPTTFILDREGTIRFSHMGFKPGYEDQYAANIKTLIRE
ncbi:MAG: TlpA disulfide reductase family protein [Spongiibacteraceae bacterium]